MNNAIEGIRLCSFDLLPGSHVCFFYESEAEHEDVVAPFLKDGLRKGEKVTYVRDAHSARAIEIYVEDELDLEACAATGQLHTMTFSRAYMHQTYQIHPGEDHEKGLECCSARSRHGHEFAGPVAHNSVCVLRTFSRRTCPPLVGLPATIRIGSAPYQ